MILTDEHAEICKDSAGKPYRPSNGLEGDLFRQAFCGNCIRWNEDVGCRIAHDTMDYCKDDPEYPREWIYGDDGQPKCTAYQAN